MNSYTMSMANPTSTIEKHMKKQGFHLIRNKRKMIWGDEFGNQVVTSNLSKKNINVSTEITSVNHRIKTIRNSITKS